MVQPVNYDPNLDFAPGFPGMKMDSGFGDVVSIPAGTSHLFGTLIATVAATGRSVLPIGTNSFQGIAIHDHNLSGRYMPSVANAGDRYIQYDAISVMRKGRIWARASGTCTKDAVAKYDPATGIFADAGSATLKNARFITGNISVVGIDANDATSIMVAVELHDPSIDDIGAS
jgi:hypothetical protein